jgi:hypothetical protein
MGDTADPKWANYGTLGESIIPDELKSAETVVEPKATEASVEPKTAEAPVDRTYGLKAESADTSTETKIETPT